jgi:hypothetical protein
MSIVAKNRQDVVAIRGSTEISQNKQSTARRPNRFVAKPAFEKPYPTTACHFGIASGHTHTLTCSSPAIVLQREAQSHCWTFVIKK